MEGMLFLEQEKLWSLMSTLPLIQGGPQFHIEKEMLLGLISVLSCGLQDCLPFSRTLNSPRP